jgi:hypothetical protein
MRTLLISLLALIVALTATAPISIATSPLGGTSPSEDDKKHKKLVKANKKTVERTLRKHGSKLKLCAVHVTEEKKRSCADVGVLSREFPSVASTLGGFIHKFADKWATAIGTKLTEEQFMHDFVGKGRVVGCTFFGLDPSILVLAFDEESILLDGSFDCEDEQSNPLSDVMGELGNTRTRFRKTAERMRADFQACKQKGPQHITPIATLVESGSSSTSSGSASSGTNDEVCTETTNDDETTTRTCKKATSGGFVAVSTTKNKDGSTTASVTTQDQEKSETRTKVFPPGQEPKFESSKGGVRDVLKDLSGKAWDAMYDAFGGYDADDREDEERSRWSGGGTRSYCFEDMPCGVPAGSEDGQCLDRAANRAIAAELFERSVSDSCRADRDPHPDSPRNACARALAGKPLTAEDKKALREAFCKEVQGVMQPAGEDGSSFCEILSNRGHAPQQTRGTCNDPRAMCTDERTVATQATLPLLPDVKKLSGISLTPRQPVTDRRH